MVISKSNNCYGHCSKVNRQKQSDVSRQKVLIRQIMHYTYNNQIKTPQKYCTFGRVTGTLQNKSVAVN